MKSLILYDAGQVSNFLAWRAALIAIGLLGMWAVDDRRLWVVFGGVTAWGLVGLIAFVVMVFPSAQIVERGERGNYVVDEDEEEDRDDGLESIGFTRAGMNAYVRRTEPQARA